MISKLVGAAPFVLVWALAMAAPAAASSPQPWMDASLSPDVRADMVLKEMTPEEKLTLVYGYAGAPKPDKGFTPPPEALGSAGYVPGIPRLGIPAQQETDAGLGVAWAHGVVPNRLTVSLPAGLATAATWNPQTAFAGGAMIGKEARQSGFNVMLAGGINLAREPRNGRNFEYAGEDPLLAGTIVGEEIRGIQSNHIISTIKHYALNDQETGRMVVSSNLSDSAARESDLLAFRIAIARSDPGSVMCSYNRVNGAYACENEWLLKRVLKDDWKWPGYVMSDWGAAHSTVKAAMAGLDQESAGQVYDKERYFEGPLHMALATGAVPAARLDDMVHRILRTMFAKGVIDDPPRREPLDIAADGAISQLDAEQGAVLLKNAGVLPLAASARRIAIIGGHADAGVLSGGGSSQVMSPGGNAVPDADTHFPRPVVYHPSSPMRALQAAAPQAEVRYADGRDPAAAARLAAGSDVAIVFATQWMGEGRDAPDLSLPDGQDQLIAAVAAANPKTIVVLETGGPVKMPWLARVAGVLEVWYPGTRGGEAIARLLTGQAAPSGRLPVTFPQSEAQSPRAKLDGVGLPEGTRFDVNYNSEGALVGYKWFQARGLKPLFPFGFGLTYSRFGYSKAATRRDADGLEVSFDVTNLGRVTAVDTPQVYVAPPLAAGEPIRRLAGWTKVELRPGETRRVTVPVDPRVLARYVGDGWRIYGGAYQVYVAHSAADTALKVSARLPDQRLPE